jgi:hypothetical protein
LAVARRLPVRGLLLVRVCFVRVAMIFILLGNALRFLRHAPELPSHRTPVKVP